MNGAKDVAAFSENWRTDICAGWIYGGDERSVDVNEIGK